MPIQPAPLKPSLLLKRQLLLWFAPMQPVLSLWVVLSGTALKPGLRKDVAIPVGSMVALGVEEVDLTNSY